MSRLSDDWNVIDSVLRVYKKLLEIDFDIIDLVNKVSVEDVIKYFDEELDGMGKRDGFPRNQQLPNVLRMYTNWEQRDLTEDEFLRLIVPDGSNILLKDKDLISILGDDSILVTQKYLQKIQSGEDLLPIIVRVPIEGDPQHASFYIEDGAHRAIAAKVYFEKKPYKPMKAYIGSR